MSQAQTTQLWEILVPRTFNTGEKISLSHHQAWDGKIRKIAGGLTILKSAKGQWVSSSGELFEESMIPVRIACTEEQIRTFINLSMEHYEQEAIMAYLISERVLIIERTT